MELNLYGQALQVKKTPCDAVTKLEHIHSQDLPSLLWEIKHDMNKYVEVKLFDSANEEFMADISFIDKNNITIELTTAISGKAILT